MQQRAGVGSTGFGSVWARCVSVCLVLCAPLLALDGSKRLTQYAHRVWGQEEGLVQPTVYSILQTRDGFLWLGTQDSLIRFDGQHFREYEYNGRAVLHGSLIRALAEDKDGNLWAATIGNGLAEIGVDGTFRHYTKQNGLPAANAFCLDRQGGDLLACTESGLMAVSPNGSIRLVDPTPVRGTCEAPDGIRWAASTQGGLTRGGRKVLDDDVSSLVCAHDGSVWAGTSAGVLRIDGSDIRRITTANGLPDNAVDSLSESPDGSIWIGTDGGITRWKAGDLSVYRTRDGLSHSVVLSMYFDREGTMWAGTKDGLDEFTNPKLTPYTTTEGLASNEAGPLAQDAAGRLWLGTLDAGLDYFDGHAFHNLRARNGLASDTVLSLAVDSSGDLWVGTADGLNRVHNGAVNAAFARGKQITAITVAPDGGVWVATPDGLAEVRGSSLRMQLKGTVTALGESPGAGLFLSSRADRVSVWNAGSLHTYPIPSMVRPASCYLPDPSQKAIWIGTLGGGLMRWKDGKLVRIHVKDGLWDNRLYALLRDGRRNIWIASSKGIFRVSEQQLNDFADGKISTVTSIPFTTGQLRFECRSGVQPAALRTRDGRMWFSTTNGFVVLNPEHLVADGTPPPVRITAAIVDGDRVAGVTAVRVRPWQRNLEIRYAGLSFISPERVTFRYILEGFDKNWTDAGSRREAFFTNLPPGDYRFRVVAQNSDGIWSSAPAELELHVLPRLYQRRWFWPALAACLGLLAFAIYRWRVRQLQTAFNLVLAERTRIARELHDTLLQGLSGVTMQLQALWMRMPVSREKQLLREIILDAGQCSTEARQSLMGLRAQPNATVLFSEKLAKLCQEAVASNAVRLELELEPVNLADRPETEYQLLRIAQEALSNTVKHADAEMIRVTLRTQNGWLHLGMADDGAGFDNSTDFSDLGHFGLKGMQERATEMGAQFVVKSGRAGTSITVRVPVANVGEPVGDLVPETEHQEK